MQPFSNKDSFLLPQLFWHRYCEIGVNLNAFDNPFIQNFEGLEGISKLKTLSSLANGSIKSLSGLESLLELESLILIDNSSLDDITALENLESLSQYEIKSLAEGICEDENTGLLYLQSVNPNVWNDDIGWCY